MIKSVVYDFYQYIMTPETLMGLVRVLPCASPEQLGPFTLDTSPARHSPISVRSLNCRYCTRSLWCSDKEVPVGGTRPADDAMVDDLLNFLAIPIPISMGASVCVLYSGRRKCVIV